MDERKIQQLLIEILYTELNEAAASATFLSKITEDTHVRLYRLAKKHDLAQVLSKFVYKNKLAVSNEELRERLQQEEILALCKQERMNYAFEQLCEVFDQENLPYIPLKGAVIRSYYPDERMRVSCDIDILVKERQLETAVACLTAKEYKCGKKRYHDISVLCPNKTPLELHFNIREDKAFLDKVLKRAWDYAAVTKNSRYDFTKPFFVFHMYAHMAHHFLSGGCGIRSLMDVWVMEHKMNASYLCAKELLEKAGIYEFAVQMSGVANRCFTDNKPDAFSELVLNYIFTGGVYGTVENSIAVEKAKNNHALVYAFKRFFLSYSMMTTAYPVLKKAPFLLPFCWIDRGAKALLEGKSGKIKKEISYANHISQAKIDEIKEIRARIKL